MELDNENLWEGSLSSTIFAIQSTILNTIHEANQQFIKQHKQVLISKSNQKENHSRQSHVYYSRDKVL